MMYCFALQLRAIMTHYPNHQIRPIVSRSQIHGLELQTFAYLTPHAKPLPPDILEYVKERGFTIIHIDENHAREYYARKERKK